MSSRGKRSAKGSKQQSRTEMSADKLPMDKMNAMLEEFSVSTISVYGFMSTIIVGLVSLFTAVLPMYIFCGPMFEVPFAENAVIFTGITAAVTVMLYLSARARAADKFDSLLTQYRAVGKTQEDAMNVERRQAQEANAYAVFKTNLIFLLCFLLLSQQIVIHMLPALPEYNFAISTLVPASTLTLYAKHYI